MTALKQFTIIPPELYVDRKADHQVEQIIDNMGRPGYVLVARQMGKTNLLLNAKRKRLTGPEIFSYLDVSNSFPDVRSFFRNVVDVILDTDSRLDQFRDPIAKQRFEATRLPHKEHEWELRYLLRSTEFKLIICLDEIDALTRCQYSDQVFSFIRSVYFSGRSNFDELNRLTYLLSGVAEPSEIIKNKDISPFNIGEKIYLDDFSEEELRQLLSRAKVSFGDDVIARIRKWIGGYPRMLWDVCAALEDLQLSNPVIKPIDVDKVIKALYFSDVDTPPIDHIKRLVQDTPDVRDALISIHYGRSNSIPESVRAKLYLAGITQLVPEGNLIRFKNQVLEEALNEDFLRAVNVGLRPRISSAVENISKGYFNRGLADLEPAAATAVGQELRDARYWMGRAYFGLGDYEKAKEFLSFALGDVDSLGLEAHMYLGVCLSRLELFQDACQSFKRVADSSATFRFEASAEYARCLNILSRTAEAEHLCKRLISEPSNTLNSKPLIMAPAEILAAAFYTLSVGAKRTKNVELAKGYLEEGLEYATADQRVAYALARADLENTGRKRFWLEQATKLITTAPEIKQYASGDLEAIAVATILEALIRIEASGLTGNGGEIVDRVLKAVPPGLSADVIFSMLVELSQLRGANQVALSLIDKILDSKDSNFPHRYKRLMLNTVMLHSPKSAANYWEAYIQLFDAGEGPLKTEFAALNNIVVNSSGLGALAPRILQKARDLIDLEPSDSASLLPIEEQSITALRRYLASYMDLKGSPSSGEVAVARRLLKELNELEEFSLPYFSDKHIELMRDTLASLLSKFGVRFQPGASAKIGRNDHVEVKFGDKVQQGKFKKFEEAVKNGECEIVRRIARPTEGG